MLYNSHMEKHYIPAMLCPIKVDKAKELPADVLAFVGDAVHTLYVRSRLASENIGKTHTFHAKTAKEINAASQASALAKIELFLNNEESIICRRCRNYHKRNIPKNSSINDYNLSSAFEGILGFLYLTAQNDRLEELMKIAYPKIENP